MYKLKTLLLLCIIVGFISSCQKTELIPLGHDEITANVESLSIDNISILDSLEISSINYVLQDKIKEGIEITSTRGFNNVMEFTITTSTVAPVVDVSYIQSFIEGGLSPLGMSLYMPYETVVSIEYVADSGQVVPWNSVTYYKATVSTVAPVVDPGYVKGEIESTLQNQSWMLYMPYNSQFNVSLGS